MDDKKHQRYLEPTQEAGRKFIGREIAGNIVMLNLLRFREIADYSANPALVPEEPITGAPAYQRYVDHTLPFLKASGGEVLLFGQGGNFLIGPAGERWDAAMLVRQNSVGDFIAFASNDDYLKGIGHRIAALEDSRLRPLVESN